MQARVFNFNPGPSTLPLDVLKEVREELLDYRKTGMSVLEISHRSPEYEEINNSAMSLAKEIMGLDDNYNVLFVSGGASTQFAYIPLNFLHEGATAAYVDTGTWSTKALKEGEKVGHIHLAASSKESDYKYIPKPADIHFPGDAAYLHITSNNTIKGTQYHEFPDTGNVPLVCDMSSDIFSRRIDFSKFALFYAGAQKNLGPSGVTIVVIRTDLLENCGEGLPSMIDYRTHVNKKSLFNTPPVFGVYIAKLVLERIKNQGGLRALEKVNRAKKDVVYELIDSEPDYFRGTVAKDSRSWMNVTLRLPSENLEQKLITQAKAAGFVGLKGHRSVGGIRISLYNAMPLEGAQKVVEFMNNFRKVN